MEKNNKMEILVAVCYTGCVARVATQTEDTLPEEFLTIEAAVAWLTKRGIPASGNSVRRWCQDGTVVYVRPGRNYLIPLSELERIITPIVRRNEK